MLRKLFGKYRVLVISIALFLVFDLGVLVLNFYTSGKIAEQTEKINIAGRQRTLTQQMSKATLYIKAQKLQQWVYQDGLNELRARVNIPAAVGLGQADLRQAIRDERVKELAIEGNRFFDLLRWGIAADRFEQNPDFRSNSQGVFIRGRHEYLPIPAQDVQANPNLVQNPGY